MPYKTKSERNEYAARYREAHREKLKLKAREGRSRLIGRPRKYATAAEAKAAQAEKMRLRNQSPDRVKERWYREQFYRTFREIARDLAQEAYDEYCEMLDAEIRAPKAPSARGASRALPRRRGVTLRLR